jgi:hypothetical protein
LGADGDALDDVDEFEAGEERVDDGQKRKDHYVEIQRGSLEDVAEHEDPIAVLEIFILLLALLFLLLLLLLVATTVNLHQIGNFLEYQVKQEN